MYTHKLYETTELLLYLTLDYIFRIAQFITQLKKLEEQTFLSTLPIGFSGIETEIG